MKRSLLFLALVAILSLGLAGCSSEKKEEAPAQKGTTEAAPAAAAGKP